MEAEIQAIFVKAGQHLAGIKYYNLATCIVILYDHFLTFDMEVENIWKQNRSLPKFLWFVFRYGAPLIQIGSTIADQISWTTTSACQLWLWFRIVGIQVVIIAVNLILILRVWVLFEKAVWALAIMLSSLVTQFVVTIWAYQALSGITQLGFGLTGCLPIPKSPAQTLQGVSLFIVLLVVEVVIFLLSIIRIIRLSAKGTSPIPLVSVMFRDGIPYFFIICLVNLANVLLIELAVVPLDLKTINTEFTPVIIVIMTSRLFLNLRASADSAPDFTLVGNLGEPVQFNHGKIEIRITTDQVVYTDVEDGAVALKELRHSKYAGLPGKNV